MLFISLKGRALTDRVIHHLPDTQEVAWRSRATHIIFTLGKRMPCMTSNVFKSFCNPTKEITGSLGRYYWEYLSHTIACCSDTMGSHFQHTCSSGRRNKWTGKTPVTLGDRSGEIEGLVKDCKGSSCLTWVVEISAAHIICFSVGSQGCSQLWHIAWAVLSLSVCMIFVLQRPNTSH